MVWFLTVCYHFDFEEYTLHCSGLREVLRKITVSTIAVQILMCSASYENIYSVCSGTLFLWLYVKVLVATMFSKYEAFLH
jgi:hypothetical protein